MYSLAYPAQDEKMTEIISALISMASHVKLNLDITDSPYAPVID